MSVLPADATPGATTTYTFRYTLEQDVNADEALLYVRFPSAFTVATGACDRISSITLNPVPMGGTAICRASYGSGNTVGLAVHTSIGGGVSVPGGTEVEIVVGGVTNPGAAASYDFDPAAGIGNSTGIYTTQMMDPMFPMVMEKDIAPTQTVTIGSIGVPGACGSAAGAVFSAAPTAGLCSAGTASAVGTQSSAYLWTCSGTGGASTASCSADLGYTLTLGVTPAGSGSASCTSNPVRHGGSTTCTATAAPGRAFTNWSGDCSGTTCVLDNVSAAKALVAHFAPLTHAIATQVVPAAAGTVSCSSNPVPHGDGATCTYTANPGFVFSGWSGDCTGTVCQLTAVSGARSVTANFNAQSHSFATPTGQVALALDTGWGIVSTHQDPAPTALPGGSHYPYGPMGFRAAGPAGGAVGVTLTFAQPLPPGARLLKHIDGAWVPWPATAVGANALRFTLTDAQSAGSVGAATGDANAAPGVIDDPVVLAVPLATTAVPVPTLSAWAGLALTALLALLGLARMRRLRA